MMKKFIFMALSLVALTAAAKDIKTLVVTPEPKMACENCENTIKKALSSADGVESVVTSISDQTITIQYDADKTSEKKLTEALAKANYKASKTSGAKKLVKAQKLPSTKAIKQCAVEDSACSPAKLCKAKLQGDSVEVCLSAVKAMPCCKKVACDTTATSACKASAGKQSCKMKASGGQCDEAKAACCQKQEATVETTSTQCKPNPVAKAKK